MKPWHRSSTSAFPATVWRGGRGGGARHRAARPLRGGHLQRLAGARRSDTMGEGYLRDPKKSAVGWSWVFLGKTMEAGRRVKKVEGDHTCLRPKLESFSEGVGLS